MGKDPLAVVHEVYAAFGRGDIAGLLEMLTEDVVWVVEGRASDYPTFGTRHGRDGALGFFRALGECEDITTFEPQSFHPSGDTVWVQGRIGLKLKTNGKALDYAWAHVFTIRGGKVAAFKDFYDTALVVEAWRG